ncbi:M48 family metallopeptidase [Paenibacillus oenotherae]|uniref:M48 family metallopeptidase n=1 Tax=Paenibacillus oenotherae TaxID=1435645 RepID=A0ABS7D4F1_9BACL|nr:SprT family zinc-dependent metalloprotease [Paenibacillus oenotherae]MBW7474794.1 M48 family metallopeptidase [Paenibacillus oenotherae]
MKFEFENNIIDVHVQYGSRKKISIGIDPSGLITVQVPNATSEETIKAVVEQHGRWILDNSQRMAEARKTSGIREYHENGKFLHLGQEHLLHELIETNGLNEEELRRNLKKFYFSSCKKIVGERIQLYQMQLKVKPKTIEIVESITKWGSCSSDKKLTFNYRLAMAPIEVIDYVIIHELCHLLHMNHDRSFWRRVGSMMPDYKEKQAFLERYGNAMTL